MHEFFSLLGYKENEKATFGVIYPNWRALPEELLEKYQKAGRKTRTTKYGENQVDVGWWYNPTVNPAVVRKSVLWKKNNYPVYIVVNGPGRHNKNIKFGRALFYEHDNLSKEEQLIYWQKIGLPAPTMQVDTGNKSIHNYWVFHEPVELKKYQKLLIELVEYASADIACTKLAQLMRVPGFTHQKSGNTVELINVTGQKYSFEELRALIPEKPGKREKKTKILLSERKNNSNLLNTAGSDLVSLIEQYIDLGPEKSNGERLGLCPFHPDHIPSLSVNAEKGLYYCFACGEGGNFESFLEAKAKQENESNLELEGPNEEISENLTDDKDDEHSEDNQSKADIRGTDEEIESEVNADGTKSVKNETCDDKQQESESNGPNKPISVKTTDKDLKQSEIKTAKQLQESKSIQKSKGPNQDKKSKTSESRVKLAETTDDVGNKRKSELEGPNEEISEETKISPMLEDMAHAAQADKHERNTEDEDEDVYQKEFIDTEFRCDTKKGLRFLRYDTGEPRETYVGGYIARRGESYDERGEDHQTIFSFLTPKGVQKFISIPNEYYIGGGTNCLRALLSRGYKLKPSNANKLLDYLSTRSIEKDELDLITVKKTGWSQDKTSFIIPDKTYGNQKYVLGSYGQKSEKFVSFKGTLESWQKEICDIARGNSLPTFCLGVVFSAPLFSVLNLQFGGFHFYGGSSQGKTTSFKMALSAFSDKKWMRNWRTTDNALEIITQTHNHLPMFLDELKQVDSNKLADIIYTIANGEGKNRMSKEIKGKPSFTWELTYLSNGELSVEEHLEQTDKKLKNGQEIRLISIPAVKDGPHGAFETIHNFENSKDFVDYAETAVDNNYGYAFERYIEQLVLWRSAVTERLWRERHSQICKDLVKTAIPSGKLDNTVRRAIDRFACTQLGLELALEAKVITHTQSEIETAVLAILRAWLQDRGGSQDYELMSQMRKIEEFFRSQHSSPRFDDLTQGNCTFPITDMVGYKKVMDKDKDEHDICEKPMRYLLNPGAFRTLCGACNRKDLTNELIRQHWLIPGEKQTDRAVQVRDGKVSKFYVFREFWVDTITKEKHD